MKKLSNNRLFVLLLTLMMTLSMSGFALEAAFAAEEDGNVEAVQEVNEVVESDETEAENPSGPEQATEAEESAELPDAGEVEPADAALEEALGEEIVQDESNFRYAISHNIEVPPMLLNPWGGLLNLRDSLGEPHNGYAVVQGGCTDGTYAYYLLCSSSNHHGRIAKIRISDNAVVATSGVLNTWHGNGMTYDSKRNQLVVIAREDRKQEITAIDANSLTIVRQENVKYSYYPSAAHPNYFTEKQKSQGLAAIAYNEKFDCYIALQRSYHNLIVFDPDTYEAIGLIKTTISAQYPGTYQAMDADDQYVYLLLSPYDSTQPNNVILAIDWNCEKLLDVANHKADFVDEGWYCGSEKTADGKWDRLPTAAITISGVHEGENIYHTTDAEGVEHFYLSSYYSHKEYKWVTKKVPYQVKWKKVKKKVKWKQVKKKYKKKVWVNGKKVKKTFYKYVWKYKKKKVWVYKTKYKNATVQELDYYGRENYVYNLGVILGDKIPLPEPPEEKQQEEQTPEQNQEQNPEQEPEENQPTGIDDIITE